MKVLLVYPENPDTFWSFKHSLPFVAKRAAFAPLGLLTVAAMLPSDWELELLDLNVEPLRDEAIRAADYVFLSAMIVHKPSVLKVLERCRALATPVIAGGPLFTTGYEEFPEVEHLVLGEAEAILPELVADLVRGTPRRIYRANGYPEIERSPVPRWDLIQPSRYVTMSVQFSRGCPYDCEFCDIVVMNGRVPRTKTPEQLVDELEALRVLGWKEMVFVVDDNFIGDKRRTKELLRAIIAWRERTRPAMGFFTEASVNLADDPELCGLMTRAGFKKVFVGIETPSKESLQECHKLQNRDRDLVAAVHSLQRAGLEVMGGFIVGFDSDRPDIFQRQFEFIQRSGVATAMVGLLTALPQTKLYHRMKREGRLQFASNGNNTVAALNFEPKLERAFLENGYRELMKKLYEPKAYYQRVRVFLKEHRPTGPRVARSSADVRAFLKSLWLLGARHRGRWAYWRLCASTLLQRPRQFPRAIELAILGFHFRLIAAAL
ncbi:MAG: DUF4070 domain-containing protein [Planctomycetes bacterium]|nr:DUF4070 domain-containing protein [Planctomycetota bacterium]